MKPFIKWVGGKRQLLPELLKHVPRVFGTYYEPFLGGGALFWELATRQGDNFNLSLDAVLGDSNERLVRTWRAVRDDVERVIFSLYNFPNDEKTFYEVRAWDVDSHNDVKLAAWFIYLNKTCFNGLYRVNKKSDFNVPFGDNPRATVCDADLLRECSLGLQNVTIDALDFEATAMSAETRDFVYFDPPYIPISATSSFASYTKDGFGMKDHVRLRDCALRLKKRGVHVLLSNSSAPAVRELYGRDFEIIEVEARRSVNSKASGRGAIKEVIIK